MWGIIEGKARLLREGSLLVSSEEREVMEGLQTRKGSTRNEFPPRSEGGRSGVAYKFVENRGNGQEV